ncbi:MAG: hypothetical protein K6G44_09155 [Lentisphaeria bacterium]|nr:hypothetical protein [Lentisphaeria bacterium]
MKEFQRLPAARRFVTLRASENNVMRKLLAQEIYTMNAASRRFWLLASGFWLMAYGLWLMAYG